MKRADTRGPPLHKILTWLLIASFLNRRALTRVKLLHLFSPLRTHTALQDAQAAVPPKYRIVIAMRPDRFGFFKAAHRFFKPGQDRVRHAPGI